MAKIVRLTEKDLTRLVNRILKEDMEVEPSKEDSNEYFEEVLREGNFKLKPSSEVLYNYYSTKPSTKPNLTCDFACRNDKGYCNPENGYGITITFNRKVNQLNGFWSNKQEPGPLVELDKLMGGHDYNNGITKMIKYNLSDNEARDILGLYNEIKFQ